MKTFIALLRGINVSGQKKIKMAEFRIHLEEAGLTNVKTYIQSGNIVFDSAFVTEEENAQIIEQCIERVYQFKVPVVVFSNGYLTNILKHNPYVKDDSKGPSKIFFCFLYTKPSSENITKLLSYSYEGEELSLTDKMAYLYFSNGAGKAKMHNNFIENKLKVVASSRNLNTVIKLIEMSNS
jgi:uncharacterized protein (DUF1697 family)